MGNNNIRTMEFVMLDDWNDPVYKCIETNVLYKDVSKCGEPELYTCGNCLDGEPNEPINPNLDIKFSSMYERIDPQLKFNYMMLSRLKSDCEYYLGYGNRNKNRLWSGDEQGQIKEMKKLYNSFTNDKKPEWLTYEEILEYEKLMVNNK